jgi:tRNA dimethylallyltransferase
MKQEQKIIIISGPTASGKSALAIKWAKQYGGAVINADALQIYNSLPILSSQPNLVERQNVLHYLYGKLDFWQQCSVATWLDLVKESILLCFQQNLVPILVGGTGMYLSALLDGINFIPVIKDQFVQQAQNLYQEMGQQKFIQQFGNNKIIDKQKLIRYASVYLQTNKTIDFWHQQEKIKLFPQAKFIHYTITLPRLKLYENCNLRFLQFINNGAILEVEKLQQQIVANNYNVIKTIGFAEISQYLAGKISLETACNLASQKTRNYAKRQLTWINNRFSSAIPLIL